MQQGLCDDLPFPLWPKCHNGGLVKLPALAQESLERSPGVFQRQILQEVQSELNTICPQLTRFLNFLKGCFHRGGCDAALVGGSQSALYEAV